MSVGSADKDILGRDAGYLPADLLAEYAGKPKEIRAADCHSRGPLFKNEGADRQFAEFLAGALGWAYAS